MDGGSADCVNTIQAAVYKQELKEVSGLQPETQAPPFLRQGAMLVNLAPHLLVLQEL